MGLVPVAVALASCSSDAPAAQLNGVDLSGGDPAIRPQDDLYRHVNGAWLRDYQLPPDKASVGAITDANDRTLDQLRAIIESISDPEPGSEAQQIKDLYDARLDLDEIERLGITPLSGLFAAIDKAPGKPELAKEMAIAPIAGLIGMGIGIDRKNSKAYIPSVGQSGLMLGEQYYRKPEFAEQLAGYQVYLEKLAQGIGLSDPVGVAQRVLDLEKRIAAAHWDSVRLRDTDATYNLMSWDELTKLGPQFDWDPWLSGMTDRPKSLFDKMVVGQPSFVTAAAQLWSEVDIALWRDYLKLHVADTYARFLPKAIADARFEFVGRVMAGLEEKPEMWRSAVGVVDDNLGEPLGKLYVDKHFPPSAKERAKEMVADVTAAWRDNFTNSTWMSQATRQASIAKLDKIVAQIGYPDKWVDYSSVEIKRGKLIESLLAINAFESKRAFARLGTEVDRSEWGMSPQTVNAYYSATTNQIVFPAAYLQPPFFDKDATDAVNYGAVGSTISHEIGHGFDDQGSKYDGDGNRRDWWQPEDRAAFDAKTQQIIAQYDVLVPEGAPEGQHVNGALTVGENLADLRGLQIALEAYKKVAQRSGETPDFRSVFLSWARQWRDKQTVEATLQGLQDTHSPNEFRCNQVVRNINEFYTTFDVKEGDKLFMPADQRVAL
ncbi:M13 family metallopeptidase [Nocardia coubleae]|uniref:M13 family metallopeptidase n=2 Tax=Nocardia coubleae TaxID=356147 RepID=A0A846W649_9NOCA|nr:M13 family metallopeptidase [Nocardia coubleae]NKX88752.1 M13 family metallopeptidase [Nocardia coubleae]